jgi:hypothetical protein
MGKERSKSVSRAGAYIVKAAESRSTRVSSTSDAKSTAPNVDDKRLVEALLKVKHA